MKPVNSGMKPNSPGEFQKTIRLVTAGLIVLNRRQLLLAYSNNKQAFYLPGGKVDKGETTREALIREIREELNIELAPDSLEFYSHITAPAFGENAGIIMEQDCFIAQLPAAPAPSAEIGALEYFNTLSYKTQSQQAPGVIQVMQQLQQDGLID
jgi:8-oxo-dGTP pyrophosphatase MutT (NUDIX family)